MKKTCLVILCMMILTPGVFAMERSVGGGILFNTANTSGSIDLARASGNIFVGSLDWTMARTGFGVFGFFGINRFLEFNLGFLFKNPDAMEIEHQGVAAQADISDLASSGALQFGVYGKYPFVVSDRVVLFPTGGIDVEITLSNNDEWWSDIWLRAGAGMDYFLNDTMFIRSHIIYGAAIPVGGSPDWGVSSGHGLLLKVGLGWMF